MSFTFTKSTPATGAQAIYELKERLKTAGWVVKSSSDGTTYNSTGDQISSGGSGAGGMANNSAWFRIQSPAGAGSIEYTFQRGTTNIAWRCKRSLTAGFSGGTPGTTQTPSATDQGIMFGAGTDGAPTYVNLFASDNTYRWNVGADGAAPYGWWAGGFPTGGGVPTTGMVHEPLDATESTDGDKYVFMYAINTNNPWLLSAMGTPSESATTASIWGTVAAAVPSSTYRTMVALGYVQNSTNATIVPNGLVTNPISSKDEGFPIPFARHSALVGPGWKGISTVMRWTGTSRTTGDTLTVSSTRDRIVYRDVSLPWDGSVPTV